MEQLDTPYWAYMENSAEIYTAPAVAALGLCVLAFMIFILCA